MKVDGPVPGGVMNPATLSIRLSAAVSRIERIMMMAVFRSMPKVKQGVVAANPQFPANRRSRPTRPHEMG